MTERSSLFISLEIKTFIHFVVCRDGAGGAHSGHGDRGGFGGDIQRVCHCFTARYGGNKIAGKGIACGGGIYRFGFIDRLF